MYLLYAAITPADVFDIGADKGQGWVIEAFEDFWTKLVQGPPYASLATIAGYIAVFAIAVWVLNIIEQRRDGGHGTVDLAYLGRFVLIIILLAHPGEQAPLSAKLTYQLYRTNNGIVYQYYGDIKKSLGCPEGNKQCDPSGMGAAKTRAIATIADAIQSCPSLPDKEAQNDCYLAAQNKMHRILQPYLNLVGTDNWANKLGRYLDEQIAKAMGGDYGNYKWRERVVGGLFSATSGISQYGIVAFLFAFGAAVQFLTELAALLTAFAGPFALAFSLADLDRIAPLKLWFSGFLGIAAIKLSYNIAVALTAYAFLKAEGASNFFLFPIVMGILAPILAVLIGLGSGVGIFAGLSRLASGGAAYLITPKR